MTLTLLLVRHAKSEPGLPMQPDHERVLNARGRRDASRMGRWIAEKGLAPEEVLCSDAQRTRETLDLMLPQWPEAPRLSHRAALYSATTDAMLRVLGETQGERVALVGHNPGIGALAGLLASEPPQHPRWGDFPTCGVAALAFEGGSWSEIAEGRGKVLAFGIGAGPRGSAQR